MDTVTRRPLATLKTKKLPPPPRQTSPEKSGRHTWKNGREASPLERRLVSIRLHLLHNTSRRTQPPSEPTLVFDSFLYLGGLKSLSNKVKSGSSMNNRFHRFILLLDTFSAIEDYSHSLRCLHSAGTKSHSAQCQTSFSQSWRQCCIQHEAIFRSSLSIHRRSTARERYRSRSLCLRCFTFNNVVLRLFDETSAIDGRTSVGSITIASAHYSTEPRISETIGDLRRPFASRTNQSRTIDDQYDHRPFRNTLIPMNLRTNTLFSTYTNECCFLHFESIF